MRVARLLLACCALAASFAVSAQYQWIDQDGSRVFSDRAPPAHVPESSILSRPRGSVARAAPAPEADADAEPAANAAPAAVPAPAAAVDTELEARKKLAEAAEAERVRAVEARQAAARAENCSRARSAKASFESGQRMARMNDKGEREILDDAQRATELQRIEQIIASECR
jgi:hypothetical protein